MITNGASTRCGTPWNTTTITQLTPREIAPLVPVIPSARYDFWGPDQLRGNDFAGPAPAQLISFPSLPDPSGVPGHFPPCVKFLSIGCDRYLSIHVHRRSENFVILHAVPAARLFIGFKKGTSPQRFRDVVEDGGDPTPLLHAAPLWPGQVLHIAPGIPHSWKGPARILEVTEPCCQTIRYYDRYRRETDPAAAIEATDFAAAASPEWQCVWQKISPHREGVVLSQDLEIELLHIRNEETVLSTNQRPEVLTVLHGSIVLATDAAATGTGLHRNESVYIPGILDEFIIRSTSGAHIARSRQGAVV